MLKTLLLFLCLTACSYAMKVKPSLSFSEQQRVLLEEGHTIEVPEPWEMSETSPNDTQMRRLIFAVKQQNTEELERIFWEVSDPSHENYGKYITIDEITEIVAPKPKHLKTVQKYIESFGIPIEQQKLTKNRDFITIYAPLSTIQKMTDTQFYQFENKQTSKTHITSLGPYSVPEEVSECLDFIGGIMGFPIKRGTLIGDEAQGVGTSNIGPGDLRKRYNVTTFGSNKNNSQAVAEFQDQFYSPSDLAQFFKDFVPYHPAETVTKVFGTNDGGDPGTEANLDIQYIMGVAAGVPTWFWINPSMDFWSDLTAWTTQISDTADAPWVHSVSYGSQGEYPSKTYRTRLDTEFKKLGDRGLSIIFASGDSGTGCLLCAEFEPSFPATSIYVTSVGATRFLNGGTGGPEGAVEAFGSGGGLSWFFPIPGFQEKNLDQYFTEEKDLPESFYYNRKGRGTPDVAALGIGFSVIKDGATVSVGGTSCAAPTFSAIVSLLNEIRLDANKPTLGYLNTLLYGTAAPTANAFFDVTEGDNQHSCCGYTGFKCAKGWDPVTGLGTANFEVLSKVVKSLP